LSSIFQLPHDSKFKGPFTTMTKSNKEEVY